MSFMDGLLKGGKTTTTSNQTQSQSSSSQTNPWAPAQANLQFGLSAARNLYDQRLGQGFFPGKTYADFSPESEQALTGMTHRASAGNPLVPGAQQMVGDTLSGTYLDAGNPHFGLMAGRVVQSTLPAITAQWARAGRGTGNNEVVEAASRGVGDALGQLAYQNYATERGNQFQAAGMAPTLAAQDYADLERLASVGAAREGMAQKGIDEARARYQFAQDQPANALRELTGFTQPIASMGSSTTGSSSGTTSGTQVQQSQMSPMQLALGLGLAGAGLATGGASNGLMGAAPGVLGALNAGQYGNVGQSTANANGSLPRLGMQPWWGR